METLISLEGLSREDWLKTRLDTLGSSDAPAVLGLSRFKSGLELFTEKTERLVPKPVGREARWGQLLEPVCADEFTVETGLALVRPTAIYRHPERKWMTANPDRFIDYEDERGLGILEIKTASAFHASAWADDPPLDYQVQLQHQLCVTGLMRGRFAVLIGGQRFEFTPDEGEILRSEKFCSWLIEKEEEFWDCVQRGIPPKPDGSDSAKETLLRLYPKDNGQGVELSIDAYEFAARLRAAKERKRTAEKEIQECQNRITAMIGEATLGVLPAIDGESLATLPQSLQDAIANTPEGLIGLTWRHQHRDSYSVAAVDYRVLREEKHKTKKSGRNSQ
jgi:putative phage-type endonuclease